MKRAVNRLSLGAVLVAFAIGASACAESGAESGAVESVAGTSTVVASVVASSSETTALGDFGSRYSGAPVAFWFWAPY